MKASTKARKLQTKLAYYILSGRKCPTDDLIISRDWYTPRRIYHVLGKNGIEPAHCKSCRCDGREKGASLEKVASLCGGLKYNSQYYPYRNRKTSLPDLKDRRPCKRCLASLSKVANSEKE